MLHGAQLGCWSPLLSMEDSRWWENWSLKHMASAVQHLSTTYCYFPLTDTKLYCLVYRGIVHWRCWLGSRKDIWPVKNWVVGCWRGYLSGVRCRFAHGPDNATATHYILLQEIQTGFTFLAPAYPGSPRQNPESHKICCNSSSSSSKGLHNYNLPKVIWSYAQTWSKICKYNVQHAVPICQVNVKYIVHVFCVLIHHLLLPYKKQFYLTKTATTRSPAKARFVRPYGKNGRLGGHICETGSRNTAATQKINSLTLVSSSLL